MRRNKKNQIAQKSSSVEQAITDANWDKRSSWDTLASKSDVATWKEGESRGQRQSKK